MKTDPDRKQLWAFLNTSIKSPRSFPDFYQHPVYCWFHHSSPLFCMVSTLLSFPPDVDECANRDTCQHECKNTFGSYQCLCPPGYQLMLNGKTCQGERDSVRMLVAATSLKTNTGDCEEVNVFFLEKIMLLVASCSFSFLLFQLTFKHCFCGRRRNEKASEQRM